MRVRFMLFSIETAERLGKKFHFIGDKLSSIFMFTQQDLDKADLNIDAQKYLTASFFSALVYFFLFFILIAGLFFAKTKQFTMQNIVFGLLAGILAFFGFFALHIFYPRLLAEKRAAEIDASLIFALKSMLVQVKSGISLFDAMTNISRSDYGLVSEEMRELTQEISAGVSEVKALERLALKTRSEYLKRTCWQLLTSIRSGASLANALENVVLTLVNERMRAIKSYTAELNIWILMYLMLAATIPTLGITFLVILSAMGGASIEPGQVIMIVVFGFVMQIVLIGFVKSRVPKVFV
jgi:flagellar protein FlaJ